MKTDGWEGWGEEKPHKSMSGGLDILACDATLEVHEQRGHISVYCLRVLGLRNEHDCV